MRLCVEEEREKTQKPSIYHKTQSTHSASSSVPFAHFCRSFIFDFLDRSIRRPSEGEPHTVLESRVSSIDTDTSKLCTSRRARAVLCGREGERGGAHSRCKLLALRSAPDLQLLTARYSKPQSTMRSERFAAMRGLEGPKPVRGERETECSPRTAFPSSQAPLRHRQDTHSHTQR